MRSEYVERVVFLAIDDTDRQWERWGRQNPYFAVTSKDSYRRELFEGHRAEFFQTGEILISDVLNQLERTMGREVERRCALDFGCGVGRLVIPLAARFERVVGVDVSPSMLREAGKNCDRLAIHNVEFHLSDDSLRLLTQRYDFVNSYAVFQHIPPRRGYKILDRLLGLVAPTGGTMIHLSLRRRSSKLKKIVYFTKHRVPLAVVIFNVLQGKRWNEPLMQMNEYDLPELLKIFARHGMQNVQVTLELHGDDLTARLLSFPLSERPCS